MAGLVEQALTDATHALMERDSALAQRVIDGDDVIDQLEVEIDATPERAWSALTEEIDRWWLPDFRATGDKSTVTLEAKPGGLLLESHPSGTQLIWYTVQMVQPGSTLYLIGHTAPDWGGPSVSMLKLALSECDGGTLLTISDSILGRVSESHLTNVNDGWNLLFGTGFKEHVERGLEA